MRNHVTFATGKGILVKEHGDAIHDSAAPNNPFEARRSRPIAVAGFGTALQAVSPSKPPPTTPLAALPPSLRDGSASEGTLLTFDPTRFSSRFLRLETPTRVACHTNCSQSTQGTAFLTPAIRGGEAVTLRIRCNAKPGRMRYFIGCAPAPFDVDAGQAAVQASGYSLENLKAGPNCPAQPCGGSAPPCFHTGSVVTMWIDLQTSPGSVRWEVDTTGVVHTVRVDPNTPELLAFVSLYNREAVFELM